MGEDGGGDAETGGETGKEYEPNDLVGRFNVILGEKETRREVDERNEQFTNFTGSSVFYTGYN